MEELGLIAEHGKGKEMTASNEPEPILDIEIVAETIRYARAAPKGQRPNTILGYLKQDFPDVDEPRLLRCMSEAADKLLAQHS